MGRIDIHRRTESKVFHQNLLSLLGMGAESKERTHYVVCYRAGDESRGLDLGKRRENIDPKLVHLFHKPTCFFGRLGWRVCLCFYGRHGWRVCLMVLGGKEREHCSLTQCYVLSRSSIFGKERQKTDGVREKKKGRKFQNVSDFEN